MNTALSTPDQTSEWHLLTRSGPVLATAIHDGHRIRPSLRPYLAISDDARRREEDPLTSVLCHVADTALVVRSSRFECDLNRPRDKAISSDPADTFDLKVWHDSLPAAEVEASRARHDGFYLAMSRLLDRLLEQWGSLLLLDIHSYNHRRDGPGQPAAAQAGNPDIDLGVTTLDPRRWSGLVDAFHASLSNAPVRGRSLDVRRNVRYPGGGHFPEWVYARYGEAVCTLSLEYKKFFMDEWTAGVDLPTLEDLRTRLADAVALVREDWPCQA